MKQTITKSMFRDAFIRMGRKDQFSYEALGAIFDYLEGLEEGTGDEMELDPIGICCEFTEYDSIEDFWNDYDKDDYPDIETVGEYTQVIMIDDKPDAFIIVQF